MKSFIFRNIENRWISDNEYLSTIFQECKRGDIVDGKEYINSPYMVNLERIININDESLLNYNSDNYLLEAIKNDNKFSINIISKTQELIEKYYLKDKKKELLNKLSEDYNFSKKIILQNGNSLEINHDTKEGDFLLKIIEEVNNIQEVSLGAYIYTQQNANMGFRIMPEIAKYIFKDMFVSTLPNGTNVNSRIHNKAVIFENNKHKIEKANNINELNIINWSFINPNGVIVDINKKADKILADASTSEEAKTTIKLLKDKNGEIHLIRPISELE